ncbi:MAG: tail fiber protein [Rikenellaceae bacterium]|nr:tail fiber protein [Rikenellaceae bacterium]
METVIGNFLKQPNRDFPLDCDTLATLQNNTALVAAIGNIAGDKVILYGCEPKDNGIRRDPGYVFVRTIAYPQGEVLYWEGGNISEGMYVKTTDVTVSAQGYEYPQAYTKRTLAPGVGSENFKWTDFVKPRTSAELNAQISELIQRQGTVETKVESAEPFGIVKMWAGASQNVPAQYALCNGAELPISEHAELHKAMGNTFNSAKDCNGNTYSTRSGYFRLPDLRGRFIVGYNDIDNDYKISGSTGGEKRHTLTGDEMPAHSHPQNLWQEASGNWKGGGGNSSPDSTSWHDKTKQFGNTGATGGNNAHENRPPYYVLAYIIKVR